MSFACSAKRHQPESNWSITWHDLEACIISHRSLQLLTAFQTQHNLSTMKIASAKIEGLLWIAGHDSHLFPSWQNLCRLLSMTKKGRLLARRTKIIADILQGSSTVFLLPGFALSSEESSEEKVELRGKVWSGRLTALTGCSFTEDGSVFLKVHDRKESKDRRYRNFLYYALRAIAIYCAHIILFSSIYSYQQRSDHSIVRGVQRGASQVQGFCCSWVSCLLFIIALCLKALKREQLSRLGSSWHNWDVSWRYATPLYAMSRRSSGKAALQSL